MRKMTFGDLVQLMGDLGVIAEWDLPPSIASVCQSASELIESIIEHGVLGSVLESIDTEERFTTLLRADIALTLLDSDTRLAPRVPADPDLAERSDTP